MHHVLLALQVNNVRLPKEGTTNRLRGFGYAEVMTKQDIEEALALKGEVRERVALGAWPRL